MRNFNFDGFERVNKTVARRLYNHGMTIYVCAVNVNPNGALGAIPVNNKDGFSSFDGMVNGAEYYNCNAECGRYLAYYLKTV